MRALSAAIVELARVCRFPILAEPTSQLRFGPHDHELVVDSYDAIARWRPEAPDSAERRRLHPAEPARARPRAALRRDADEQAAALVARRFLHPRPGRLRSRYGLERADPGRRC